MLVWNKNPDTAVFSGHHQILNDKIDKEDLVWRR